MNKKSIFVVIIATLLLCGGCLSSASSRRAVYQYSTINAFMLGFYEGDLTTAELKGHGDFGIGTFNGVDGELILLDKLCYQAKPDGRVVLVKKREHIPFITTKHFKPDLRSATLGPLNYKELLGHLDSVILADNLVVAIRIQGYFSYVKVRSIEKQSKPYQPFAEVVKNQRTSEFRNLKGTLVGFRFPDYMRELNVPGYHFHFISADKKFGGHVLDCNLADGVISIDEAEGFFMQLPASNNFQTLDLAKDMQKELLKAEIGKREK